MANSIIGSVGEGGQNRLEDVRTIYALFNKVISTPLAVSDQCSKELIQAIRDFQKPFMSRPDGRIDVGRGTWRKLLAATKDAGSGITGSVGEGGQNRAEDVRTIYALFNKILPSPLVMSEQCSTELIQAIRDFQKAFMSRPDGRIDVGGRTWGKLTEATTEPDSDVSLGGAGAAWTARYQWNDSYETEFSQWVKQLFANKKGTLAACLRNSDANTLYSEEDRNNSIFSDCADLPYLLRAYFSYKKKLSFSFSSTISGSRYTNNNEPRGRRSFLNYSSFTKLAQGISNSVHSGFFRFFWTMEKTDTYLVVISRESIIPGVVYYDAKGHVLVVSRVDADGTVWFVDAHPDNSLTSKRFGEHLSRGSCKQGGGFRCWRQQYVSGSSFTLVSNGNSKFFDSKKSQCQSSYQVDGADLNCHQWVKRVLATGSGKIDPLREIGQQMAALEEALQARVVSIEAAVSRGIHGKPHPASLPYNIYGTEGEWEAYSTPGRDARLKAQFREIFNFITQSVTAVTQGDHPYEFSGSAGGLIEEYDSIWQTNSSQMQISYTDSVGTEVALTLADIMDRLFKLSFDPYHCPELRWGDTEAASCPDGSNKKSWYEREQRLRNVIDSDNRVNTPLDWGPQNMPDIHIGNLLERLEQQYA